MYRRLRFHSRPSCRVMGCCTIAVYRDPRPVTRWSRVSVLTISERRAALGNDTPAPKQMNGAVSRTRLGINRWLARDRLFGYYFAPVWGTIPLMVRPEKPQFSLGWIFSESSNSASSSGESRANLKESVSFIPAGRQSAGSISSPSSSATTIAIGSDQPRRGSELLDARLQFLLQSGLAKSPCCGFATRILAGVGHGSAPAFS
jgi:hypothetical protein